MTDIIHLLLSRPVVTLLNHLVRGKNPSKKHNKISIPVHCPCKELHNAIWWHIVLNFERRHCWLLICILRFGLLPVQLAAPGKTGVNKKKKLLLS